MAIDSTGRRSKKIGHSAWGMEHSVLNKGDHNGKGNIR
jgi:hypothetical protein